MFHLSKPAPDDLAARLSEWRSEPLSYKHQGGIGIPPETGFIVDAHEVLLGRGESVFQSAGAALDEWKMFPAWAGVARVRASGQEPGEIVAMIARICGLWWVNPCRILRRCDGPRSHGFVYGTLPEHAECGEEQFVIEWRADDSVWYVIRAFSRPRHWMAWAAFPLARWWQCRFVRDSQARMKGAVS
ncbi:MAG TPA: DUF1990 domain-containing protein [Verrucomicrobiales bacterium]|nr:DUF1990 domain-containing protein [Verrucomicrobiales bacterium]HRJ07259.1 DUF1990 domain-containing protein [Prosthecobacter sp.]HRK13249.1 DUF1990 domain-containing protein [Prosthecobacter sp.]